MAKPYFAIRALATDGQPKLGPFHTVFSDLKTLQGAIRQAEKTPWFRYDFGYDVWRIVNSKWTHVYRSIRARNIFGGYVSD